MSSRPGTRPSGTRALHPSSRGRSRAPTRSCDAIVVEQHIEGARLGAGVTVPRRQALLVGADIADAIAALHASRIMHGAIGSEAVVLDTAGRAILGGAGAKLLQAAALGGAVTDATPTDDLRQLGRLLYILISGRAPGTPATPPVELVPDIEPALNGLILSLLSEDELRPPPPAAAASLRLRDLAGEPAGDAARRARQPPRPARFGRAHHHRLRARHGPRGDRAARRRCGLRRHARRR